MSTQAPHFLLYAHAGGSADRGRWKFVLQAVGGGDRMSAADSEPRTRSGRLELLAVVRGLEALDQPSRVTLLTRSRYVRRGLRRELAQWRDRRWHWERFGQVVPIQDHDLWQRVDRALCFHQVECCAWPTKGTGLQRSGGWMAEAVGRVRRGVLTAFSAVCRPAFTRAA
jgi:ribonuclease HI